MKIEESCYQPLRSNLFSWKLQKKRNIFKEFFINWFSLKWSQIFLQKQRNATGWKMEKRRKWKKVKNQKGIIKIKTEGRRKIFLIFFFCDIEFKNQNQNRFFLNIFFWGIGFENKTKTVFNINICFNDHII